MMLSTNPTLIARCIWNDDALIEFGVKHLREATREFYVPVQQLHVHHYLRNPLVRGIRGICRRKCLMHADVQDIYIIGHRK